MSAEPPHPSSPNADRSEGPRESAPDDAVASLRAYDSTLLSRFDRRVLDTRAARIAMTLLLAAILIVPSIQLGVRIHRVDPSDYRTDGVVRKTALGRWMSTAELVTKEQRVKNPYGYGHWFPLPPFILMLLAPLSKLGFTAAAVVWGILKLAGIVLALTLLIRALKRGEFAVPLGVLFMAALFSLRPIVSDIQHGNVNVFVLVWITLAWALYLRQWDFWAGVLVALAIVTKITPALLLLYFLYKRAWRVCLGCAVGLILFFVLIPGLFFGFTENFVLLKSWFDMLIAPFALKGYAAIDQKNQSLYGVLLRLGGYHLGWIPLEGMPLEETAVAGMPGMGRPAVWWGHLLRPAISLSLIGALAWLCRARCLTRKDPRRLLELALVLLAMLLLSERTWKHHGTTMPLVYLAVWYALTCVPWSDRFRAWFVGGLVVQWVLLVGSSVGLLGSSAADLLLIGGAFAWGWLLCFVQIAVMLWLLRKQSRGQQSHTGPFTHG